MSAEPSSVGPAIELVGVRKCYGRQVAVADLSLTIRRGEIFAFLGPNGAGKTTTIKMIAGLLRPNTGRVTVCGHEMNMNGTPAKALMSYVPDQPFLYDKLTGREFLEFVGQMYDMTVEQRRNALKPLIERLALGEFLDRLTETYSHGMKQRVVLAAALMHDPEVLVIDEPMVGLDPRTARSVKDAFRERARAGRTVFMSTHTLEVAEAIADRIGILNAGHLVALGTLDELKTRATREHSLEDIFLRMTETGDETVV
ncbi:MAG: ABC transporter [Planctomycetota bacterium]|nr:MAG: ABC transporter [Planctomycetota bacterium]